MRLLTIIGLIYCVATAGCSKGTGENEQVRITETSKVMVKADGSIYLNKKQVSSEQLADELKRLKSVSGALWYCREFPEREPTQAQFDVFKKLVEAKLSMKLVENLKDFEEFLK